MEVRTEKVIRWIERKIGGRVTHIDPQARWRPVWFAEVEVDGEKLELCVRGDRLDCRHGFPLEHEMHLQEGLYAAGIRVAKVYGWCNDPRAYIMDRVRGVEHFHQTDDAERDAVMHDYMEILAEIHRLEIQPFVDAGILRAERPEDSGRLGMKIYEDAYRAVKKRPDPFLEFCLAWLKRNPLDGPIRETVIVWDSGQLMHENGRVTAAIDLEIGHIGDPMMDLAGFRMRTSVLGFGDFNALYDHYEGHGGQPIDRKAIQYYHFCFTLSNQLAFHDALASPPPGSDYMTNMQWCAETNIYAMEALAEILGIDLDEVPMLEAKISTGAVAHAHLIDWLRNFEAEDDFTQHQFRIFFRLARHLARTDEIGDAVDQANLDELEELLGTRPATWQEGDAALEQFVLEDDGRHDEALLRLFHRRTSRYLMLCGPKGSAIARHNPIPDFKV
ncbi:MAG: phosphotransferase family protein [bacterium]|nr:protein kinase [Deltaproteobacteria bacterium]MCP4906966.1 phosphotransferase family protein [bacterium]